MQWVLWSIGEALTKTLTKIIQKLVGGVSFLFAHMVLAAFVISVVQTTVGYGVLRKRGVSIWCGKRLVTGALLFGVVAFFMTVLAFSVFLPRYSGSVGISTFIITLAIFPSAVIDSLVFKDRFSLRTLGGFVLGIFAGYIVLGLPSLQELLELPAWVWLSCGVMILGVANELISRQIKAIHPMAKNFWGGVGTLACCLVALLFLDSFAVLLPTTDNLRRIYALSSIVGLLVLAMWSFKVMSYKTGAGIALKSLVMNGTYLSTTMIAGMLFFNEAVAATKFLGILLYVVAFLIANDATWQYVRSRGSPNKVVSVE
jgi:drug/metabolite transporter (DMT)-like permease